ncbi:MAG: zinc dependent phospholipase C family protein [Clostridia bacterium]|nr:zinc dependent phospholipase C family protein [Clostridia bacterium]
MPSTYAHYCFGEKVALNLSPELKNTVENHKQLYYIGLHGPDILFYFKPLGKNPVNSSGYEMHERPASEFFKRAADMLESTADKNASVAYLAGFVCHYALDKACHGYIEKKIEVSGLAHAEIENEFDRFLINLNGGDLKHTDLTKHIVPSKENAGVIAPFFENVTAKQVRRSLKSIKFYNGVLIGNRAYKRGLVNFCLKISGKYDKMKGSMFSKEPIPACLDSDKRLYKLFLKAIGECVALQNNFYGYLNGKNSLEGFNFTFGAGDNWKNIPVFAAEEEDMYEV